MAIPVLSSYSKCSGPFSVPSLFQLNSADISTLTLSNQIWQGHFNVMTINSSDLRRENARGRQIVETGCQEQSRPNKPFHMAVALQYSLTTLGGPTAICLKQSELKGTRPWARHKGILNNKSAFNAGRALLIIPERQSLKWRTQGIPTDSWKQSQLWELHLMAIM